MNELFNWLKDSDLSIQFRLEKEILKSTQTVLSKIQTKMLARGWGHDLMSFQKTDGYWEGYYSPKWISTHYTLQTLRCLNYPKTDSIKYAINRILVEEKCKDGGSNCSFNRNKVYHSAFNSTLCVEHICVWQLLRLPWLYSRSYGCSGIG